MKIVFFAHSTTIDNQEHRATGWLPGKLSPEGINQAKALPKLIDDQSFSVVYCSDLQRAIESAKIGFSDTHPLRYDWRLREANYGKFDGQDKKFKKEMHKFIDTPYPNGESYKEVEERIKSFLQDMQYFHKDDYIAIIGHEATQLAMEVIINRKSWDQVIKENWRPKGQWKPGWQYCY
ncbi:histidine phosphatase family protein [Candidatus Saccharibacteria bacterium]|nr:histidine phosphatase family protein [Candidatus Saccharibacteria bacterium]